MEDTMGLKLKAFFFSPKKVKYFVENIFDQKVQFVSFSVKVSQRGSCISNMEPLRFSSTYKLTTSKYYKYKYGPLVSSFKVHNHRK
jgi:hypothetical protein